MTNNTTAAEMLDQLTTLIRCCDNGVSPTVPRETLLSLRALLAAPRAAGVPEGWKLVPIEPTQDMLDCWWDGLPKNTAFQNCTPRGVYASMLDAAPAAPVADKLAPTFILTVAQLLEALDFIAPDRTADQFESDVSFQYGDGHSGKGMYCWSTEYPDEGAMKIDGSTSASVAEPVCATPGERAVIDMLIALARATSRTIDDSEECTGDDGRFHAIGGPDFDEMSDALDALDDLPDDKPGYALDAGGKAEWALRNLGIAQAVAADGAAADELLQLDVLLANLHAAVWHAGAGDDGPVDYDMAGREEAKAIQAHVRTMLAERAGAPVAGDGATQGTEKSAFEMLKDAIQGDDDYAWGWHCNIAMPIMDSIHCTAAQANKAGADLMQYLFKVDVRKFDQWNHDEPATACVCGEPETLGTVHRTDGPCYVAETPATAAAPLNGIAATIFHGEGAISRCSYCGRYSLDRNTLGDRPPKCECGEKHGWSGSFKKPGPDAKWSGAAPAGMTATADERAAFDNRIEDPKFMEAWPEISKAGYAYGWLGIGLASWRAALASQAAAPAEAGEPAVEVVREYFAGRDRWDFKVLDRTLKHGEKLYRTSAPADAGEAVASIANLLTPYGLLVRALRIVAGTTLMEMATGMGVSPAFLSSLEFGRRPVTHDNAIFASGFFSDRGVIETLPALAHAVEISQGAQGGKGGE